MVVKNKIFMVYNHYNLQVFNCENYENKCFLVSENINNDIKELRGGTPYQRFMNTDYFVSFANVKKIIRHESLKFHETRISLPAVVIIKVNDVENPTAFKLVYISEPLDFDEKLLDYSITGKVPKKNFKNWLSSQIHDVGSIARWNYELDQVDLVVNINDRFSAAVRIIGLTKVVKSIIINTLINSEDYDYACIDKLIKNYIKIRGLFE